MKLATLTYAQAAERFPAEVAKAIKVLRASKSKYADSKPEDITWTLECATTGRALSVGEFFGNVRARLNGEPDPLEPLPPVIERTNSWLQATVGPKWFWNEAIPNPPEAHTP